MTSVFIALLYFVAFVGAYTNTNNGLTAVPEQIPDHSIYVDLSYNQIASVDPTRIPSSSVDFRLHFNQLTSFPNLSKAAGTLEQLRLQDNKIEMIDPPLLNILTNLATLFMTRNRLAIFPDVPGPGSSLAILFLSDNRLTTFPSLKQTGPSLKNLGLDRNKFVQSDLQTKLVSDKLEDIYFDHNKIRRIPLLLKVVKRSIKLLAVVNCSISAITKLEMRGFDSLRELRVSRNNFVSFPDLSAVQNTLTTLYLGDSEEPITPSAKTLQMFTNIHTLYLEGILWKYLPNFCQVKFPSAPVIHLDGNVNCDCHLVWLKLLEARPSSIVMDPNYLCSTPDAHRNKDWRNITITQFECGGLSRESFSTAIDVENYYCASAPVVSKTRVRSASMCFMKCLYEPSCIYFNVEAISGSPDVLCSVTDINKADLDQPNSFTNTGTWYSID